LPVNSLIVNRNAAMLRFTIQPFTSNLHVGGCSVPIYVFVGCRWTATSWTATLQCCGSRYNRSPATYSSQNAWSVPSF